MKPLSRSYAGGEVGPELYGRVDLTKHQTGLALAQNFEILPHGPARNRAGFGYVNEVKLSAKKTIVRPFNFGSGASAQTQTYVLELGDQYIRVHTMGATLLSGTSKNITDISRANPGVVTSAAHGYSNGDWLYLQSIAERTRFLSLPGVAGAYASTPDSVANSVMGDIDIRVKVALNDWTPAGFQSFVTKWAAVGRSYILGVNTAGTLALYFSVDGSTSLAVDSSVATGFADGNAYWLRVTRAQGSGTIKFYTSNDGVAWAQLGIDQILAAGSAIYDGTAPLTISGQDDGSVNMVNGKVYYAEIRNGIDGPVVAAFNPQHDVTDGAGSFSSSLTGETWTVNGTASIASVLGGPKTSASMSNLNGRWVKVANKTTNTYQLTDLAGSNISTSAYDPYTSDGTSTPPLEVVSPFLEADLFSIKITQSADVLTLTHPSYDPQELKRISATNWTLTAVPFVPTIATPAAPGVVASPASGSKSYSYKTTAIADGTLEESLPSAATTVTNDLTVAGNLNTVTTATVSGAVRYNVYRLINGLYGYIGQTDGSAFVDNNIAPDTSKTPAIPNTPFAAANDKPAAVGYYKGRRWFAGTNNKPQSYWGTVAGTESNLGYSIPTRDSDSIAQRIIAQEVNRIRHIVPAGVLVLLTSGGAFKVAPENSDILTPTTAAPTEESNDGASDVGPIKTGRSILYVQDASPRIREIKYSTANNTVVFDSNDISVMVPHLFDDYQIADSAYVKSPYKFAYYVRSDGVLLAVTHMPEHEVIAWHQHTTDGLFESVAAVKEGAEYPLYAIVKRTVNGRQVRYIERQRKRAFGGALADAFFVDSGLTYSGAPATVVSGLLHLEGKTVAILADGAEHPNVVVSGGAITLQAAASKVQVGLPYAARFQTMPLALEGVQAAGQGAFKSVNEIWMRVFETQTVAAGPSFSKLVEFPARSNEPYDSPPALKTREIHLVLKNKWGDSGQVCIEQAKPLPITILSHVLGVTVGG